MINAAGVPLLLAAMALSSGVALCLGAGLLLRRTDVEGYMYVIAEYVWVTLWVVMAFAVFAVVGVVVFRMLSRRLTRPIEKFARDVDALVRCDKSDPVDADTRIAEIDALAAAFNRLQSVRARQSDEIRNLARNVLHDLRAPITNIYNEADRRRRRRGVRRDNVREPLGAARHRHERGDLAQLQRMCRCARVLAGHVGYRPRRG